MSVPTNKNIVAEIAPHISSALRDLGVVFEKYILSSCPKLADADPVGTLDLCSGGGNEQKNTQNIAIKGEIRTLSTSVYRVPSHANPL